MVQHVGVGHLEDGVDALIAGAGPTGLSMAAEAIRFGLSYRIVDKAVHRALQSRAPVLQARVLEQFERYELAQRAIEAGIRLQRIRVYNDGQRILEAAFDENGGNYPFILLLPQALTERFLIEHIEAQGGNIEREVEVESFADRGDAVECVLRHADGRRETVRSRYLLGCDGADSAVRRLLDIPTESVGPKFEMCAGDVRLEGDVPRDELRIHIHEGSIVLIGRIDATHYRVIFAPCETPGDRQPELRDFQNALDDAGVENVRALDPRWTARFASTEKHADSYGRGRVFLAGDAANLYSAISGQGLNSDVQDASNLIWKIALVVTNRAPANILDSYPLERKPHVKARSGATPANWVLQRLRDGLLARFTPSQLAQERLREAFSALQTGYRSSPIVRDCGGASQLHAGDRASDCEVVDETQTRFRLMDLLKEPIHTAIAVMPQHDVHLQHFTAIVKKHQDVMQGSVLVDGDDAFRMLYGSAEGMLYVVRPDGYIGFRAPAHAAESLERWCAEIFNV